MKLVLMLVTIATGVVASMTAQAQVTGTDNVIGGLPTMRDPGIFRDTPSVYDPINIQPYYNPMRDAPINNGPYRTGGITSPWDNPSTGGASTNPDFIQPYLPQYPTPQITVTQGPDWGPITYTNPPAPEIYGPAFEPYADIVTPEEFESGKGLAADAYRRYLGREGTGDEINVWGYNIAQQGLNFWQVKDSFQSTGEARGFQAGNADVVVDSYRTYLGRDPEWSSEGAYWHNLLNDGNASRDEVRSAIANSPEARGW